MSHRKPSTHEQASDGHRLRILVASESPLGAVNGVTGSVKQTLKHLRDMGHEAKVVCPKPAPKSFAGFEVVTTRSVPYQGLNLAVPGPRKLRKQIERFEPDVVHVASPFWTLGRTAIAGARQLGVPAVAIYQTDIVGYSERYNNEILTRQAKKMTAALHNMATRTLAPSQAARADLIEWGVNESLIHLWGRGVDVERYYPGRRQTESIQAMRGQLSPDGRPIVGYVGRLATEKNVEQMACLKGLGAQIVIVGDGPTRPDVEAALPGDTVFLGQLGGKDLARAYASFDLFVHTGAQETFGQTLQEAMATGLAVVAPAAGGPLDIVGHGTTGLLYDPADDESLRSSVAQLLDNQDQRLEMGRRGRAAVELRSWSALGAELVDHYRAASIDEAALAS